LPDNLKKPAIVLSAWRQSNVCNNREFELYCQLSQTVNIIFLIDFTSEILGRYFMRGELNASFDNSKELTNYHLVFYGITRRSE